MLVLLLLLILLFLLLHLHDSLLTSALEIFGGELVWVRHTLTVALIHDHHGRRVLFLLLIGLSLFRSPFLRRFHSYFGRRHLELLLM